MKFPFREAPPCGRGASLEGKEQETTVKIKIFYPHLQQFTNNQETVGVDGDTVGECLRHLVSQFPGLKTGIFDKDGQLLNYVYFFINGKGTYPTDLTHPLKDGDELTFALLLAGG